MPTLHLSLEIGDVGDDEEEGAFSQHWNWQGIKCCSLVMTLLLTQEFSL